MRRYALMALAKALTLGALTSAVTACSSGDLGDETAPLASVDPLTVQGVEVTVKLTSDWGAGYCADVVLTNRSSSPVTDWNVVIELGGATLANAWSATTSVSGTRLSARPIDYNKNIAPGSTASFGFCANGSQRPTLASATITGGGAAVDAGVSDTSGGGGDASAIDGGPDSNRPDTNAPEAGPADTAILDSSPGSIPQPTGNKQVEDLDRGVVAVATGSGVFVSFRLLGWEPANLAFNVYRGSTRVAGPLTRGTNAVDAAGRAGDTYTVRAIYNGVEQPASPAVRAWSQPYLNVALKLPTPAADPKITDAYSMVPNDATVADLDGDGTYEIVLKVEASNGKDNSQSGFTGPTYLQAYKLDGTLLWTINLGRNIRTGAHYTQFMVYDFDGDGRAEVACKTADGTVDALGKVIGSAAADYRNSAGYVLDGPEFLTMFDGRSGGALSTVNYNPARGRVADWGDGYGNRVDRFLAGVAYLDGKRPSLIMSRGYYTRTVIAAWDFRDGRLTPRWTFDTTAAGNGAYAGQGNHQLSIADVDADGKDEIVFGGMVVDDNGRGLWNTGYGHGDALHIGDLDPARPGLEIFRIQERVDSAGAHLLDARTGATLWRKATVAGSGEGPGRGVSADIDARFPGAESWVAGGGLSGLWDLKGNLVGNQPSSCNFLVWWDADPVRELLDSNRIDKYGVGRLLTASGVSSNNGTKSTPALSGDIFGDWREEVIWRATDNQSLRIYTTTTPTDQRIYTLMHDTQYRTAIAWQNVAYNQPPHPSFFIGDGMGTPPRPDIHVR